jgi:hypothetical protein
MAHKAEEAVHLRGGKLEINRTTPMYAGQRAVKSFSRESRIWVMMAYN